MTIEREEAERDQVAAQPQPLYDADEASRLLNIPKPTLYEHGRTRPEYFGVVRIGRRMMFRRRVINELVV